MLSLLGYNFPLATQNIVVAFHKTKRKDEFIGLAGKGERLEKRLDPYDSLCTILRRRQIRY
jgi:hypothetical protein